MEKKTIAVALWVLLLTFTFATSGFSANITSSENESDVPRLPESLTEEQIDAFLARMSDDQVRRLIGAPKDHQPLCLVAVGHPRVTP